MENNRLLRLFGFKIGKKDEEKDLVQPSFTPPNNDDGALTVTSAAQFGVSAIDLDGSAKNEIELITRYREMAMQPEVESAIDDIVNESIVHDDNGKSIELIMDELKQPEKIKKAISEEFKNILKLLNFNNIGTDIFRRYYVDGRLFYHVIVDIENPQKGIQELRYIDPRKIRKIREIRKQKDPETGVEIIIKSNEYYLYSEKIVSNPSGTLQPSSSLIGVKISPDSIVNVNSGLMDAKRNMVISYLQKCIAENERIRTINGWKSVKDVVAGDIVYSYDIDNNVFVETKVVNQWKTGNKELVEIFTKHSSLKCTPDHPILVKESNEIKYVFAESLIPKKHKIKLFNHQLRNEEIKFPKLSRELVSKVSNPEEWIEFDFIGKKKFIYEIAEKYNQNKHKIYSFVYGNQPLETSLAKQIIAEFPVSLQLEEKYSGYWQNDINIPEYIDEDFAKLFGFLLGDGWVNTYTIGFAEGVNETQNEYYASLMTKYFGNCNRIVNTSRKSNYKSWYSNNTLGCELLKTMGFISGAKNKRIPNWVFESKPSIKLAVIEGFHDADGCDRSKMSGGIWSSSIGLCNENLIKDIKELWTSLGYSSGKIRHTKVKSKYICGSKNLTPDTEHWTIYLSKKLLPEWENVIAIKQLEEKQDVFELEVEDKNHNFVVNGVVVKNCIKPLNQLRMIEDAIVIYRLSRASERLIFYIDVGSLPKLKAEQYIRDIMTKYKNKIVYDSETGSVRDDRRHLSLTENYWLPRRCISLNSKIKLLDGRDETLKTLIKEFEEGKQNWTYSVAPNGSIVPGKISWAGITRKNTEVIRVNLDNGEFIECTPDHKFILRDGTLCEAQYLNSEMSLMPLYTREHKLSVKYSGVYSQFFDNEKQKWIYTHRMVSDYFNGNKKSNEVIHHIDFTRNNNPENLRIMNKIEHFKLHSTLGTNAHKNGNTEEWYKKLSISGKSFFQTEKGQIRRQEISKFNISDERILNGLKKGREIINEKRYFDKINLSKEEYFKKWINVEPLLITNEKNRIKKDTFDINLIKTIIINSFYPKITVSEILTEIQKVYPTFKYKTITKFLPKHGYRNLFTLLKDLFGEEYKRSTNLKYYNHKVVSIEKLQETQDTGTLTIDEQHEHHNYHNFALSCGIFIKNSDGKSTEITTLQSGQNLSQIDDIQYFEKKLYKSLNVPVTRLDPSQAVSIGRSTEITRDELKFAKFIEKLRGKFSELFDQLLRIQLVLKGVCTEEEWNSFKEDIFYDFIKDNNFEELKETELMQERLGILAIIDQYSGKYYSKKWIQEKVLRLNGEEIIDMQEEIDQEKQVDLQQQALDQENQIKLQAQAQQLQSQLMPAPDQQIEAGEEQPEQPQEQPQKPKTPYHINNQ